MDAKEIGVAIEAARIAAGKTKRDVARDMGMPYQTYCSYAYGKREANNDVIVKLANYYGLTVDELLGINKEDPGDHPEPISVEEVYDFLVRFGFVQEGEDISEDDISFLSAIFAACGEWFRNKKPSR
jgi:transcriptional regulator with XRE-family HTH domain